MQEEKYNLRDMSYSVWHRRLSTQKFVGLENAELLAMIDADVVLFIEYHNLSKEPSYQQFHCGDINREVIRGI